MTLTDRIDQAIDRIIAGHSPQRIPADLTDPDIVLTDCKARIAELEAELADAVDYGRGRHEAERRAEEAEQALATVTRERDEARASAGVLLDAFHGVLEALADSEGILEGITGDARGMAVAQLADNHRAVTAFTAALSSPASDWLAARDRRVAEMQREALAKAMRGGMHAAFAQGGESVECACSSCTNRRAALAEWEKP